MQIPDDVLRDLSTACGYDYCPQAAVDLYLKARRAADRLGVGPFSKADLAILAATSRCVSDSVVGRIPDSLQPEPEKKKAKREPVSSV